LSGGKKERSLFNEEKKKGKKKRILLYTTPWSFVHALSAGRVQKEKKGGKKGKKRKTAARNAVMCRLNCWKTQFQLGRIPIQKGGGREKKGGGRNFAST